MSSRNHSINILFLLSLGRGLTVYDLSKLLGSSGRKVSNGALIPILLKLTDLGYVSHRQEGRRKIYSLTAKGRKYVASVRKIRERLKENALSMIVSGNAVQLGLLKSVDDMSVLESVLDRTGEGILRFLAAAFRLEKNGEEGRARELTEALMRLLEDYP